MLEEDNNKLEGIVALCPFCNIGDIDKRGIAVLKTGSEEKYVCGVGQEDCAVVNAMSTAVEAERKADYAIKYMKDTNPKH